MSGIHTFSRAPRYRFRSTDADDNSDDGLLADDKINLADSPLPNGGKATEGRVAEAAETEEVVDLMSEDEADGGKKEEVRGRVLEDVDMWEEEARGSENRGKRSGLPEELPLPGSENKGFALKAPSPEVGVEMEGMEVDSGGGVGSGEAGRGEAPAGTARPSAASVGIARVDEETLASEKEVGDAAAKPVSEGPDIAVSDGASVAAGNGVVEAVDEPVEADIAGDQGSNSGSGNEVVEASVELGESDAAAVEANDVGPTGLGSSPHLASDLTCQTPFFLSDDEEFSDDEPPHHLRMVRRRRLEQYSKFSRELEEQAAMQAQRHLLITLGIHPPECPIVEDDDSACDDAALDSASLSTADLQNGGQRGAESQGTVATADVADPSSGNGSSHIGKKLSGAEPCQGPAPLSRKRLEALARFRKSRGRLLDPNPAPTAPLPIPLVWEAQPEIRVLDFVPPNPNGMAYNISRLDAIRKFRKRRPKGAGAVDKKGIAACRSGPSAYIWGLDRKPMSACFCIVCKSDGLTPAGLFPRASSRDLPHRWASLDPEECVPVGI